MFFDLICLIYASRDNKNILVNGNNKKVLKLKYFFFKNSYLKIAKGKIMFKNKRNFSIITIALVAIIGLVYAGCSNNANMQTTPDNSVFSVKKCENATGDSIIESNLVKICVKDEIAYVIPIEMDCDSVNYSNYSDLKNSVLDANNDKLVKTDRFNEITNYQEFPLLQQMKDIVASGSIEFKQNNMAIAYEQKIDVLINMLANNNFNGAKKKGLNDLYKHTNTWIIDQKVIDVFNAFLYITNWQIDHPDIVTVNGIFIDRGSYIRNRKVVGGKTVAVENCNYTNVGWRTTDGDGNVTSSTTWLAYQKCQWIVTVE